jgi:biotin transport system ATP-binding protein
LDNPDLHTNVGAFGVRFVNTTLRRDENLIFERFSVSLTERRVGIIGNNGSGKSSLLRLINGLLLPDEGSVHVCGVETRKGRKQLPGLAGFLFQNPEHQILFPTVGEEIAFGLRERSVDAKTASEKSRAILASHGLGDWEHKPVQHLSDGQKQRLCILSVMVMEPRILLLDEPFASLDLPSRRSLADEILAAPQQIIMASHDFDLLARFDRVVWLDRGKIAADGAPVDVLNAYQEAVSKPPDGEVFR